MKNSRKEVVTAAGAEALIGVASFVIGSYYGLDPANAASIASYFGAGVLGQKAIDFTMKGKAKDNPMYFLWQLEKKTKNR